LRIKDSAFMTTRRQFLTATAGTLLATVARDRTSSYASGAVPPGDPKLAGLLGITLSSAGRLAKDGRPDRIPIADWPRLLRDELDMRVLDLNSAVIESHEPAYLEQVRRAADDAGCVLTNMKINRADVDIGNADPEVRRRAIVECRKWIDTSGRLGLRWARPLPLKVAPDRAGFVAAYRELADYAAERNVQMVVENYGWMSDDAETMPRLLEEIGRNVAPAPDTGNWSSDAVRYAGLARLFPRAVTCDFKAGRLGPDGEHEAWDLERCFTIGWDAGFRGPWCFEHAAEDRATLFRELRLLRDMIRRWTAERTNA
jgi:hypothetical protein